MISVKFLLVHNTLLGRSVPEVPFGENETVSDMKKRVFDLWTTGMPELERWEQLRFVFKGKVLKSEQRVGDIFPIPSPSDSGSVLYTVHMLVRPAWPQPATNSLIHIQSVATGGYLAPSDGSLVVGNGEVSPRTAFILRKGLLPGTNRLELLSNPGHFLRIRKTDSMLTVDGKGGRWCDWSLRVTEDMDSAVRLHHTFTSGELKFNRLGSGTEAVDSFKVLLATPDASWPTFENPPNEEIHFHGCIPPDNEDVQMLQVVFDRHRATDSTISMQEVGKFLKSSWVYMQRVFQRHVGEEFPMEHFRAIKTELLGSPAPGGVLNFDQFVQFWFLFDRDTSAETCSCGQKELVLQATAAMHQQFKPEAEFDVAVFDRVFDQIDRGRGQLTCREVELLYFMYSWHANVRVG